MPTIEEFIAGFGTKEIILVIFLVAITILVREEKRIFRRKKR